ncbi:hypothetical protein DPSP01_004148 [Paraphaeosphaeria sporulosa]
MPTQLCAVAGLLTFAFEAASALCRTVLLRRGQKRKRVMIDATATTSPTVAPVIAPAFDPLAIEADVCWLVAELELVESGMYLVAVRSWATTLILRYTTSSLASSSHPVTGAVAVVCPSALTSSASQSLSSGPNPIDNDPAHGTP